MPPAQERSGKLENQPQVTGWQHYPEVANIQTPKAKSRAGQTHQNGKLETIVTRGNKMKTIIENLLKRSHHKKREIFHQINAKNIISDQLQTESGLNVVIKQIIRNKLKRLQEEAHEEKSAVQILLDQSNGEERFLDQTVGRTGSFLDRLIGVMNDEKENISLKKDRRPKLFNPSEEVGELNNRVEENPFRFFEDVGLIKETAKDTNKVFTQIEEAENEKVNALKFFADAGLVRKETAHTVDDDVINHIQQDNSFSDESPDKTNSFLEEEIIAAESETAFLADEIAGLLVQLEADLSAEDRMMAKSHAMIKSKLQRFPTKMLLKDKDFVDSVFIRFALMKLPLRTQDIDVSEAFQISKVLQKSMAKASVETRSLLADLRNDSFDEDDGRDRASAIDESRRQLQKLLKIVSK